MSIKQFLLCLPAVFLMACQGPNGSNGAPPLYGSLNGIESGPVWSTESLQAWLSADLSESDISKPTGVCTGLDTTINKLLDDIFCQFNLANIQTNSKFGGFNVKNDVVNNSAGVTQVNAYRVLYLTPGVQNPITTAVLPESVSGILLVPNIPLSQVKGVVLYYHGTVFQESGAPSNFNSVTGANTSIGLASVLSAQGYIVVAPDYIGMAVNVGVVHPYIAYPQEDAQSGLYMLTLTRQWLNAQPDAPGQMNLYIDSYSEGALYAMWASNLVQTDQTMRRLVESNNFTLKRTVVISGPYDLAGAQLNFAESNATNYPESANIYHISPGLDASLPPYSYFIPESVVPELNDLGHMGGKLLTAFSKAGVVPATLNSIAYYSANPQLYDLMMHQNFVDMTQCIDLGKYFDIRLESNPYRIDFSNSQIVINPCPSGLTLEGLFDGNNDLANSEIAYQLFSSAIGSSNYFTGGMTLESLSKAMAGPEQYTNNSINSFVYPYFTSPDVIALFESKSIYNWKTNSPVSLIWMRYDSTITNLNSYEACLDMSDKSALGMVHCTEVDNTQLYGSSFTSGLLPVYLDHSEAATTLNLVALHEIESDPQ